jgi:mono/diheme cytochrome c family protein
MHRLTIIAAAFVLGASHVSAQTAPLSEFQRAKAEALLEHKLPCLGCHTINGKGGRIGPDLSGVGARLTPGAIRQQIVQPRALMPRIAMPTATLDLLVGYLSTQKQAQTQTALIAPAKVNGLGADHIYVQRCAACHGASGAGDGPNARYLDRPPAKHSDGKAMSARTDDRLFDAIYAGGAIMGGSARMPAFGRTLNTTDILALVRYIRLLCHCKQPAWADGTL